MSWIDSAPSQYTVHRLSNGDPIFIGKDTKIGNVTIGRFSYINNNGTLGGKYHVTIGAFCSISSGVYCWTYEGHQTGFISTFPMRTVLGVDIGYPEVVEKPQGVRIGNDVWIGQEARIMPGITLGDGCVIGARSIVTRDCEPYGIYAGAPARLRRKRCSDQVMAELLALRWWTWPIDRIRRNARFFSTDLECPGAPLASLVVP